MDIYKINMDYNYFNRITAKVNKVELTRETRNPSTFHQILVFLSKNQDVRY